MSPRRTVVVILLAATAGACGTAPASPSPAASPSPVASATPAARATATATPSPTPTVSPSPSVTGLADFSTPAPTAADAAWRAVRWRKLAASDPLAGVTSIVPWSGGYLAVGRDVTDTSDPATASAMRTPVWVSADGTSWKALSPDVLGPTTLIVGAAAVPGGVAAVTVQAGVNQCVAGDVLDRSCFRLDGPVQSWTSADGFVWVAHPGPAFATGSGVGPYVAADAQGLVAMSYSPSRVGFDVAVSSDGASWDVLADNPLPSGFGPDSLEIVGAASSLLACGGVNGVAADTRAVVVRSVDGRTWSAVRLPYTTPGHGEFAYRVVVGRSGLLAVGFEAVGGAEGGGGDLLWWQSLNGTQWRAVQGYAPLGRTLMGELGGVGPNGDVAGDGTRMIAYRDRTGPVAWASFDGRAWQRLSMSGSLPRGGRFVVLPIGLLAVSDSGTWFGEVVPG
jgi:hypothetical protein